MSRWNGRWTLSLKYVRENVRWHFGLDGMSENPCEKMPDRHYLSHMWEKMSRWQWLDGYCQKIHVPFHLTFSLTYVLTLYLAFAHIFSRHSICHSTWHFLSHMFWHSIWYFLLHIFWHSRWNGKWTFCQKVCKRKCPGLPWQMDIVSQICNRTCLGGNGSYMECQKIHVPFHLTFSLTYVLTFYLGIVSYILWETFHLPFHLHFLTYFLTFHLPFHLTLSLKYVRENV